MQKTAEVVLVNFPLPLFIFCSVLQPFFLSLPLAGLEPARIAPLDFESSASANSATAANKAERDVIPLSLAE